MLTIDSSLKAFWASVFAGAYAGICLQTVLTMTSEGVSISELWVIRVIIFLYGMLAVPFVALGLVLFGLPAKTLLRTSAETWWGGAVAILWGGLAGKLVFYAIDHTIFFGYYEFNNVQLLDMGIIYGVPTAVAWWSFDRKQLRARL